MTTTIDGYYQTVSVISTDTTASDEEILLVDTSGGPVTVTLPGPTSGDLVLIKKISSGSNTVTIKTPGSETIDGFSQIEITNQYYSRSIASDGTDYYII